MLKKIRIILAIISIAVLTLLFLDFTGTIHVFCGWIAKMQFIPAVLALNVVIIISLVIITVLFGRIYCSVICPLGIFQDIISKIRGRKQKNRFAYTKPILWLRYGMLVIMLVAVIAGISCVVVIFEPYSAYGRIASNIFAPVYKLGNNVFAYFSVKADSYAFYKTNIYIKSLSSLIVAVLTLFVVAFLSWRNGRLYCNSVCPVGTLLGLFSRFAIFKPIIDTNKCVSCGLCESNCKSSCINVKEQTVDYSRCVVCMNCIDICKLNAIHYKLSLSKGAKISTNTQSNLKSNDSRRAFFSAIGMLTSAGMLRAQKKMAEGGLAVIEEKKIPKRNTPIKPAGSNSLKNFSAHCTACGLCVSVCPNSVLRPSAQLDSFLQPEMSYEKGYCRPECVKCAEVCPAGAINKITAVEKSSIKIGTAVWVRENCLVVTDGVNCNNCARHCPVGAIQLHALIPDNKSLKVPVVDPERCIGCGACENLCPSRPFSAIYVEGVENHRII